MSANGFDDKEAKAKLDEVTPVGKNNSFDEEDALYNNPWPDEDEEDNPNAGLAGSFANSVSDEDLEEKNAQENGNPEDDSQSQSQAQYQALMLAAEEARDKAEKDEAEHTRLVAQEQSLSKLINFNELQKAQNAAFKTYTAAYNAAEAKLGKQWKEGKTPDYIKGYINGLKTVSPSKIAFSQATARLKSLSENQNLWLAVQADARTAEARATESRQAAAKAEAVLRRYASGEPEPEPAPAQKNGLKGRFVNLLKGFVSQKKTTSPTNAGAVSAAGGPLVTAPTGAPPVPTTSLTAQSTATAENEANLSIEDIHENFKKAIDAHQKAYGNELKYTLSGCKNDSFTFSKNDDQFVTVRKNPDNSVSYAFSGDKLSFKMADVVLRACKDPVLILSTTNLEHMEAILKAAAMPPNDGKITIKFSQATEEWLQKQDAAKLGEFTKFRVKADEIVAEEKQAPKVQADSEKALQKAEKEQEEIAAELKAAQEKLDKATGELEKLSLDTSMPQDEKLAAVDVAEGVKAEAVGKLAEVQKKEGPGEEAVKSAKEVLKAAKEATPKVEQDKLGLKETKSKAVEEAVEALKEKSRAKLKR
jgi:hypothetical protein